jgi:antitoxin (DNA-binding transcriptional repressor) of toxin-antitoxin stability system
MPSCCIATSVISPAADQFGKGRLGLVPGVFPQQSQVVGHFSNTFTQTQKANRLFCGEARKRRRAAAVQDAGVPVGRVTPCAPPWQTRTRPLAASGAQRTARPTRAFPPAPGFPASANPTLCASPFPSLTSDFSCDPTYPTRWDKRRPTRKIMNQFTHWLFHFLHHQHFNRQIGWNEFEA